EARRAIQDVSAWGGTPLGEFMKTAADALLLARSKDFYGEYRLLVVTDGEATDPDVLAAYLPDIMSRGLTVDVIGVDMRGNHSLATQVDSYRRADDPTSLTRAIREVFAETSADANDTGGTDFELLEGLPDDFAAAALTALAQSGNEPIGQRTTADVPVDAQGVPPANILVPPGRQPPAAPENRRQLPFFVLIIIIFVVLRIVGAARRARR
ncbi:MAG TPA: vWA domain-containing protein, partial [Pirellulaceae bacterium]